MITLIYVIVLIGIIVAPVLWFLYLNEKQKQNEQRQLLQQFNQSGADHGLTFSSQDVLRNTVIGLDGVHRKLLVVEKVDNDNFRSVLISLQEVVNCTVRKQYGFMKGTDSETKKPEQFPEEIFLQLDLAGKPPVQIVFYKRHEQGDDELARLETKARQWATILSKMYTPFPVKA